MLTNMLVSTAIQVNNILDQQCWPTFIKKLINVGQHFLTIFSFTNMLVGTANQANIVGQQCWRAMLANMLAWFAAGLIDTS